MRLNEDLAPCMALGVQTQTIDEKINLYTPGVSNKNSTIKRKMSTGNSDRQDTSES